MYKTVIYVVVMFYCTAELYLANVKIIALANLKKL